MGKKLKFNLTYQRILSADGKPVTEIQLFKTGDFVHWSGVEFTVDETFMSEVIGNFQRMKAESKDDKFIPIDYNHASLNDHPDEAKAAGWVLDIFKKDDGLYATVEWTRTAAQYITEGEYRYISPEFSMDAKDEYGDSFNGPIMWAGALTNRPFFKGMSPVELSDKKKEKQMDKDKLIKCLGAKPEATEDELISVIETNAKVLLEVGDALGIKAIADLAGGVKSAIAERDAAKAETLKLSDEVKKLASEKLEIEVTEKVEKLIREDKIDPAQKSEFIALAKDAPKHFDALTAKLSPKGRMIVAGAHTEEVIESSDYDSAVKKIMADKKCDYLAASREVQKTQPELAKKHAARTN